MFDQRKRDPESWTAGVSPAEVVGRARWRNVNQKTAGGTPAVQEGSMRAVDRSSRFELGVVPLSQVIGKVVGEQS